MTSVRGCERPDRDRAARDYVLGRLAEAQAIAFEDHVVDCPACAALVSRLEDGLGRLGREAHPAEAGREPAWRLLVRTVLGPVPAAVYLAALLAVVLWTGGRRGAVPHGAAIEPAAAPEEVASVLSRAVGLFPEPEYRGDAGTRAIAPATVPRATPFLLELHTDLGPAELAEPGATLSVELADAERVVWTGTPSSRAVDDEGLLRLAITEPLAAGRIYTLVARLGSATGAGEVRFRRSFVVGDVP